MFKFTSIIILFLMFAQQCTQNSKDQQITDYSIKPKHLADLPKNLKESSGLAVVNHKIYSINDKGGDEVLFVFNNDGKFDKKIKIKEAKNTDWESLAANSSHFFIGDFGNNSGDRKDLSIYYFPIEDLNKNKIKAKKINFKYSIQKNFSSKKRKNAFDGEALIALENELVIFSKDWIDYNTQVYHIPLKKSDKTISISPSEKRYMDALITGADYDSKSQSLVLCGYKNNNNYIWVFEKSSSKKFLSNHFKKIKLEGLHNAQIEAVAFLNSNQIIISTEETKTFKQQMWVIEL